MALRKELLPIKVDRKVVKQVKKLVENVIDNAGNPVIKAEAIRKVNEFLGVEHDLDFIQGDGDWPDFDEFVMSLVRPIPKTEISKEELVEICKKIENGRSEDYYIGLLEKNFSFPDISDLIYNPDELGNELGEEFDMGFEIGVNEPSIEEIADIIWEYEKTRDITRFKRKQS